MATASTKSSVHDTIARLKEQRKALLFKVQSIDEKLTRLSTAPATARKKSARRPARLFAPREVVTVQSHSAHTSKIDGKTGIVLGAARFKGAYWYTVGFPAPNGCWQVAEAELKSTGRVSPLPENHKPVVQRVRVRKNGEGFLVRDGK